MMIMVSKKMKNELLALGLEGDQLEKSIWKVYRHATEQPKQPDAEMVCDCFDMFGIRLWYFLDCREGEGSLFIISGEEMLNMLFELDPELQKENPGRKGEYFVNPANLPLDTMISQVHESVEY